MKTLVMVNGKIMTHTASLKEVRNFKTNLNLKLLKTYTFLSRTGLRRVLRFESQGEVYSVSGPARYLDANTQTWSNLYFGFDKSKAIAVNGKIQRVKASGIDFSQPHLRKIFSI